MHRHDRPRVLADGRRGRFRGQAIRVWVDVGEDGYGAGVDDGLRGGEEAQRRDDDLIPWSDAEGPESDRQRLSAVSNADAVPAPQVGREGTLEGLHLRPEDVATRFQYRSLALEYLLEQRLYRGSCRKEWNHRRPTRDSRRADPDREPLPPLAPADPSRRRGREHPVSPRPPPRRRTLPRSRRLGRARHRHRSGTPV